MKITVISTYAFSMGSHQGTGQSITVLEVEEYTDYHILRAIADAGIDCPLYVLKGECLCWNGAGWTDVSIWEE